MKIIEYKTRESKAYRITTERFVESIITDFFTLLVILTWIFCLYLNYKYLGNSTIIGLFVIFTIMLFMVSRIICNINEKVRYENLDDFIENLRKELEGK